LRERNLALLHYVTGVGILVFGAIHVYTVFLTHPLQGIVWETTLRLDSLPYAILPVYRNVVLAASLFGLLLCTTIHAMNGLRTVLSELLRRRLKWVDRGLIILGAFLMIYGTRTILIAHSLL